MQARLKFTSIPNYSRTLTLLKSYHLQFQFFMTHKAHATILFAFYFEIFITQKPREQYNELLYDTMHLQLLSIFLPDIQLSSECFYIDS